MSVPSNSIQLTTSLSDDELIEICTAAGVIACECPGYLARLLRQVRSFRRYTEGCIEQFPEDAETHYWLISEANKLEQQILGTIAELMRREGLLDESSYILLDKMSERAQIIMLKQIGQ